MDYTDMWNSLPPKLWLVLSSSNRLEARSAERNINGHSELSERYCIWDIHIYLIVPGIHLTVSCTIGGSVGPFHCLCDEDVAVSLERHPGIALAGTLAVSGTRATAWEFGRFRGGHVCVGSERSTVMHVVGFSSHYLIFANIIVDPEKWYQGWLRHAYTFI